MKFNAINHTYINDEGEHYVSGTALIKKYAKPFDKQKIAAKYAKKNKRKVEEVLEEWEKLGSEAIAKGTAYHKIKEDELLTQSHILIEDDEHIIFKPVWEDSFKVNNISKLEPGIYPELIVWSDRYKIAGQADYVEITKKGTINIKDYKTSKEIKMNSYEKWDGTKEMMKFPLNDFEDCNFNHYCLQLNLYAFLIKQHNRNLSIGNLTIEHILGDYENSQFSLKDIVRYEVPNLQDHIRVLLEYNKTQNK
jgi:hypothetical protein